VGIDAGTEIEKNLFHELYYHLLNTDQSEDVLCWRSLQHPQWFSQAEVTLDGQVSQTALLFAIELTAFKKNIEMSSYVSLRRMQYYTVPCKFLLSLQF
jgi:hypothetical protein